MLRMLKALKAVSNAQTLAPEGWREGKPLLSPPSNIAEDREDWFCRFVDAP